VGWGGGADGQIAEVTNEKTEQKTTPKNRGEKKRWAQLCKGTHDGKFHMKI